MRNLLGRLNARSSENLGQIADAWRTPLSGRDRLAQISQLYRTMTKPPMVRAYIDGLAESDRVVLLALIEAGESGATIQQLADQVGRDAADVRSSVVRLYEDGVVANDGTSQSVPIGESPTLFVPIEVANTIRGVVAELKRGDISNLPFTELIAQRSERELFEAAVYWGVDVVPGVTTRDQVIAELNKVVAHPVRRAAVLEQMGHELRIIWDRIRAVPLATPVSVDSLIGAGNDRTTFSRRNAINELEDRLLVWPTVQEGQVRALFVPDIMGANPSGALDVHERPKAVSIVGLEAPYRPTAPMAWDLMVVLQKLVGPLARPGLDPLALPDADAAKLNTMLWNRGSTLPPNSYVEALMEFATHLGLVTDPESTGGQFERTAAVREWRGTPWTTQAGRIRSIWMNSPTWIDGQVRQDIEPWNVDWQGFRVKLLHHLASLETNTWYRVTDIANWITDYDSGILGPDATVAIGYGQPDKPRGIATLIADTITSALTWMGLVQVHVQSTDDLLVCVTDELRRVTRAEPGADVSTTNQPLVVVADDLTVHLTAPDPVHVWSLLAFADTITLGAESVFAITADSIRNAMAAGFRPEHVVQFFERLPGTTIPPDFESRIASLGEHAEGLDLSTALVLDASNPEQANVARATLENDGYVIAQVGRRLYVSVGTQRSVRVDTERIHTRLLETGLGPVTNRTRS